MDEALGKGGVSRETTHRPDDARAAVYAMHSMKASRAAILFADAFPSRFCPRKKSTGKAIPASELKILRAIDRSRPDVEMDAEMAQTQSRVKRRPPEDSWS